MGGTKMAGKEAERSVPREWEREVRAVATSAPSTTSSRSWRQLRSP
jgi:hypothetical protein